MKFFPAVTATACAIALTAGLGFSAPILAQDQGFFIDGRAGQTDLRDISGARKETGYTFGGGYWFNRNFAIEGGWADLYNRDYPGGRVALDGFYAGVKGRALFDRGDGTGFFVGGRGGVFHWDGQFGPTRPDGTDWYTGVLAGYQFTPAISVTANYDRFRADSLDTDLLSAGIEFKF